MVSLISSSSSSSSIPFYLSTTPTKDSCPKPSSLSFQTHQTKKPISLSSGRNKLQFQLSSASPTVSADSTGQALPDLETHPVEEKFDWFSHWYALAPVCDLDKRVPHAKTVLGLDVVVWWDKVEGKWQVFDDRCPHRLAPLSEGRIDQRGRLQCVYHGWCFDGSGSCKYIPQEPSDGPQVHTFTKACASAYPSFEQNNIVWFWPSTDPQNKDIVMKKKPPYFPELDDPSYSCLMLTRDIPYGYEVLIENLMDPAHLPYAHYGIMQLPKHMIPQFRSGADREGGSPLQITVEKLDVSGFLAKQEMGDSKFIAPCVFYIFPSREPNNASCSTESLKKELSTSPQQKQRRMLLVFICIPVSPGISRLITVAPKNFGLWVERIVPRWMFHVEQNRIIDSDLYLLHLEERKIAQVGPSNWQKACFVPTKSDALVVAFRKWLRKYAHNQVDWGTKFTSELPPTPPKEQLMDRYWSHVVQCSSCHGALKGLKALEVSLQVISVALIGIVSAIKQTVISTATRSVLVSLAVLSFAASRWLSHFIYKNFYFHDYNHAFRHGTCYTNNWIQSLVSSLAI